VRLTFPAAALIMQALSSYAAMAASISSWTFSKRPYPVLRPSRRPSGLAHHLDNEE
jgi:hypothetical protein